MWARGALIWGAMTVLLYTFREREMILTFRDALRREDYRESYLPSVGFATTRQRSSRSVRRVLRSLPGKIDEYEAFNREQIRYREIRISGESAENAADYGLCGPVLREAALTGFEEGRALSFYDRVEFKVPLGEKGDCFDRYTVRVRR